MGNNKGDKPLKDFKIGADFKLEGGGIIQPLPKFSMRKKSVYGLGRNEVANKSAVRWPHAAEFFILCKCKKISDDRLNE